MAYWPWCYVHWIQKKIVHLWFQLLHEWLLHGHPVLLCTLKSDRISEQNTITDLWTTSILALFHRNMLRIIGFESQLDIPEMMLINLLTNERRFFRKMSRVLLILRGWLTICWRPHFASSLRKRLSIAHHMGVSIYSSKRNQ